MVVDAAHWCSRFTCAPSWLGLAAERVEQRVLLVLGAVAQLVEAQVVVAPLEDGELRGAAERLAERVGEPGQVPVDELALQGDGGRGDDDGPALVGGELQGGHQVGQRLAGPGAGLHGEVRAVGHRVPDGLGHDGLAGPLRSADGTDGGGEERLDGGVRRSREVPAAGESEVGDGA